MDSIWTREMKLPAYPALERNITVDIAVIGGGMAGLLTAYQLQKQGLGTVVLEADRIAGGQTQNTTAKITFQHGLIYQHLIRDFGAELAKEYFEINSKALDEYLRLIRELDIDCDFERKDAYLYTSQELTPLLDEAKAAASIGIDAEMVYETKLPFQVKGALRYANQAQFHPLKFISRIVKDLTIYEHTRAAELDSMCLMTEQGFTVNAKHIVIATHYPYLNTPGYYFMRMHQERSYVLALKNAADVDGIYYGIDANSYSFRNYGPMLLLGGGNHRTGENSAGGQYAQLKHTAQRFYPESRVTAQWSAQDCISLDHLPYIGQYAASMPEVYVATGFQKWGMTGSMAAALVLNDLIIHGASPYSRVFNPSRFKLSVSAKTLVEEGIQASKGLIREFLTYPADEAEELPNGHGGIVDYDGEKLGVYKDEQGEIHLVYPRCPHLGCQLEWNPDEKSWDCPCHGSRFDYRGRLLDNPATKNLETAVQT